MLQKIGAQDRSSDVRNKKVPYELFIHAEVHCDGFKPIYFDAIAIYGANEIVDHDINFFTISSWYS